MSPSAGLLPCRHALHVSLAPLHCVIYTHMITCLLFEILKTWRGFDCGNGSESRRASSDRSFSDAPSPQLLELLEELELLELLDFFFFSFFSSAFAFFAGGPFASSLLPKRILSSPRKAL